LNRDGSRRKISWWNSFYLCPADNDVVEYHKALVRKSSASGDMTGSSSYGQHMNAVPALLTSRGIINKRPEDSV